MSKPVTLSVAAVLLTVSFSAIPGAAVAPIAEFDLSFDASPVTVSTGITATSTSHTCVDAGTCSSSASETIVRETWRVWILGDSSPDHVGPDGQTLLNETTFTGSDVPGSSLDVGQHVFDDGTYRVVLEVEDDDGETHKVTEDFEVINTGPVADMSGGPDQLPRTIRTTWTTTSTSTDGDGVILSEAWELRLLSDPSPDNRAPDSETVVETWSFSSGGSSVSFSVPDDGTYRLTLTVTDDDGATDTRTSTFDVQNLAPEPVMAVSTSESPPTSGSSITLSADGNQDPDGDVVEYTYRIVLVEDPTPDGQFDSPQLIDSETTSSRSFTSSVPDDGVYRLVMVATDDDGDTASTSQLLEVGNQAITGGYGLSADSTTRTVDTVFTATSQLDDPDGDIATEDWTLIHLSDPSPDNRAPNERTDVQTWSFSSGGSSISFSVPDDGVYRLDLTGTDDDGDTVTRHRWFQVENLRPNLAFSVESNEDPVSSLSTIWLNTTGSYDSDGDIVEFVYVVRLLEDPTPDGDSDTPGRVLVERTSARSFSFNAPDDGEYRLVARAIDDDGQAVGSAELQTVVNLAPGGGQPPLLDIDPEPAIYQPGDTIRLTDISPGTFTDPEGDPITMAFYSEANGLLGTVAPGGYLITSYDTEVCRDRITMAAEDPDGAGVNTTRSLIVDGSAPDLTVDIPAPNAAGWFTGPVEVDAHGSDSCLGHAVELVKKLDGTVETSEHSGWTFEVTGDGVHDLTMVARDVAGNTAASDHELKVDTTGPNATLTAPCATPLCMLGGIALAGDEVEIAVNASDETSGVTQVDFYVDGSLVGTDTEAPYAATWTAEGTGSHTVEAVAQNGATLTTTVSQDLLVLG